MKRNFLLVAAIIGLISWSCSKMDNQSPTQSLGLKQSVQQNVTNINAALSKISQTKGYQILSVGATPSTKLTAAGSFNDSITLAMISGIYDFQRDTVMMHHNFDFPFRLFVKTGPSDKMIVNLPQKFILHPMYLHSIIKSDSVLKNDFTISVSAYHLYYNSWDSLDYKLTAGLSLNSADMGSFDISRVSNTFRDQVNSSSYNFTGGYSIGTSWQTGDTSKLSFALSQNNALLLQEKTLFVGKGFNKREKQYDLTIGTVEIKRGFGIDSIQVFQNGVLQKTAGAKITDSADSTGTICKNRDILLTFDDGTSSKLSTLIGPSLTQLKTLVGSLHQMYFAENIVDYIALNIFFNSR